MTKKIYIVILIVFQNFSIWSQQREHYIYSSELTSTLVLNNDIFNNDATTLALTKPSSIGLLEDATFSNNLTSIIDDEEIADVFSRPARKFNKKSVAYRQLLQKNQLLFAIKSNLLFDVLLMPNIEIEKPIGYNWSILGEWMFPWWVTKDNGNALQILSGSLEGRYWFGGGNYNHADLDGWFAGLYAGGGLYDLQYKNNGYQGEFFIAAGVSGGYSHFLDRKGLFRMEYSLGLGYLQTNYRYYEGKDNNQFLVWQYDGKYSWLGPTKAKVSLVYMITYKKSLKKRRGGRR